MGKRTKLNSKNPKYFKKDENAPKIKKRKLMCITPTGCKVYGVWYEND